MKLRNLAVVGAIAVLALAGGTARAVVYDGLDFHHGGSFPRVAGDLLHSNADLGFGPASLGTWQYRVAGVSPVIRYTIESATARLIAKGDYRWTYGFWCDGFIVGHAPGLVVGVPDYPSDPEFVYATVDTLNRWLELPSDNPTGLWIDVMPRDYGYDMPSYGFYFQNVSTGLYCDFTN